MANNQTKTYSIKISDFLSMVRQSDELTACQIVENKVKLIKAYIEKFKRDNPNMTHMTGLIIIENFLQKSQYASMLGYKNDASMKKYYDNWFANVQYKFNSYKNDDSVVTIINELF